MLSFVRSKKSTFIFIFLVILFSLPSFTPLISPGFFKSDDGGWMIIRFSAFHQALRDGQFPVRWLGRLNYEYGYPVANFLYPGFMYLAELFKLVGFNFTNSIKGVLAISILSSGVFSYLWLSKQFQKIPGFIGSIFYIYFPYHLYDIYKRGSVGESLSLGVLPLCLWLLEIDNFFLFTLSVGFLLISHNTLAVLFFPLLFFYTLIRFRKNYKYQQKYILALIIAAFLSAFFWIPALYDLRFTLFLYTTVSNWQQYFAGYELVGVATIAILIGAIVVLTTRVKIKQKTNETYVSFFFLVLSVVSIFLSLSFSFFVWKYLPVSFIQFPFRFLSVAVVGISYLAAFMYATSRRKIERLLIVFFLAVLVISSVLFVILKIETIFTPDSFYATNEATTTVKNEYMPLWVKELPHERAKSKLETQGKNTITIEKNTTRQLVFTTNGDSSLVKINTIYFPGWKVYIDNVEILPSIESKEGVMEFQIPQGQHKVEALYGETPLRLVSDFISVGGVILLVFTSLLYRKSAS